jgi:hypothetical protein
MEWNKVLLRVQVTGLTGFAYVAWKYQFRLMLSEEEDLVKGKGKVAVIN